MIINVVLTDGWVILNQGRKLIVLCSHKNISVSIYRRNYRNFTSPIIDTKK